MREPSDISRNYPHEIFCKGGGDMDGIQTTLTFIGAILGSGVVTAIVNTKTDRWKFKETRKNQKEDEKEKRNDKTEEIAKAFSEFKEETTSKIEDVEKKITSLEQNISSLAKQNDSQTEALKLMMLDRILYIGNKYIEAGEIRSNDKRIFRMMYKAYKGVNGNGDADWVMERIDELRVID